ncbi:MAG: cation:proton antiporter [Nevskia sp.]|nr:cation:proton antiporter [Nevskia sp.]
MSPAAAVPIADATHNVELLFGLFLIFAAAKLSAEIFERLKQPAVVGEILAGVLIGPHCLGWVTSTEASHLLSELGVVFLMFNVGLETKPAQILGVGSTATVVAVLGVVLPLAGGYALMRTPPFSSGVSNIEALFVGTAMVATSVGITARALASLGHLGSQSARIILGAAVIDDVLGLLVLAAVSSAAQGAVNVTELGLTALLSIAFIAFMALFAAPALTRAAPHAVRLRVGNAEFAVAVALCFGAAAAAVKIGVAAIIGAFLAGMALAEAAEKRHDLHAQVKGATELLVPFFLVNIGLQLDLSLFGDASTLWLSAALIAVAVVTKLVGCGIGALKLGRRAALQVGVGMIPRGEVGIVVAQIGLALGVIDSRLFGAVLIMACATTIIAPPLLRPLYGPSKALAE